jgi:hypothetical protein
MNVLLFLSESIEWNERMRGVFETVTRKVNTEVYRSIEHLTRRLARPGQSPSIAILLAGNKEELYKLHSLHHLLSETYIILILPHRDAQLTAIGYRLRPRFLTYMDYDFEEVMGVLMKMQENYHKKIMEEDLYVELKN